MKKVTFLIKNLVFIFLIGLHHQVFAMGYCTNIEYCPYAETEPIQNVEFDNFGNLDQDFEKITQQKAKIMQDTQKGKTEFRDELITHIFELSKLIKEVYEKEKVYHFCAEKIALNLCGKLEEAACGYFESDASSLLVFSRRVQCFLDKIKKTCNHRNNIICTACKLGIIGSIGGIIAIITNKI